MTTDLRFKSPDNGIGTPQGVGTPGAYMMMGNLETMVFLNYESNAAQAACSSGCNVVYFVMPTIVKTFWKCGFKPKV